MAYIIIMNLRSRNIPSIYDKKPSNNLIVKSMNKGLPIIIIVISVAYIVFSLFESYTKI